MSKAGFLDRMAAASRRRAREAQTVHSAKEMARRAAAAAPPPKLRLASFDVIAELKLRSPAAGSLAASGFDHAHQLSAYARGGACAVSVLTEPEEFRGSLEDLTTAAALLGEHDLPVMRKDFLTDPYQVLEARAAGAGGVLIIVTMLDGAALGELLACAREQKLFVLLEAFDSADLERIALLDLDGFEEPVLAGVNCRNLRNLQVDFGRFAELAASLPASLPTVAESGIASVEDIRRVANAGYELALVGSALMATRDPAAKLAELVAAGRQTRAA